MPGFFTFKRKVWPAGRQDLAGPPEEYTYLIQHRRV